ncbi:coiled-coil domain-containing protein 34 isoform X2 [Motacilla alba alba]|uniref:coiled-coil domain-containing protein 34 isoform X2 n=1 Tax=Motacilla alba alba TaxID=1094192 RepID=UPI0018D52A99|nr:coiled-coil domain-containing protein 34 isoform X2 [Motacilla alba alba]
MRLPVPVYWTGTCAESLRNKELRGVAIDQHRRVSARPGGARQAVPARGASGRSQRCEASAHCSQTGQGPPVLTRSLPGVFLQAVPRLTQARRDGKGRARQSRRARPCRCPPLPVPGNRSRRCPPPPPAVAPAMSGRAKRLSPPLAEGQLPSSASEGSPLSLASRCISSGREEQEDRERAEPPGASRSPPGHRRAEHSETAGGRKVSPLKDNLSPWEEWFIGKEKELRARLQARAAEEMNKQLEEIKQNQEWERRKRIAEEKHKEWVLKKREEEKEKEQEAELQEKRKRSEKIFKEWLQNARNKPQPVLNAYGFLHGRSTGSADRNLYPAPAYCNPIPWKPVQVPPTKEDTVLTMKKSQRPVSCQPRAALPVVISKPRSNPCIGSLCRKKEDTVKKKCSYSLDQIGP